MVKSIPWDSVSDSDFEKLAFFLLSEEEFYNLKWFGRGGGDRGRDLVGVTYEEPIAGQKHEKKWLVQCKHYSTPLNKSILKEDLAKAGQHHPDYWLFFTSISLTSDELDWLESMENDYSFRIMIWDEPHLVRLLNKHQEIRRDFFSIPMDETYVIEKIRENSFRNFERDLRDWLNVLDYDFESYNRYERDRFEFIIDIPKRRGYDRVLVVGIDGAIEQSDVVEIREMSKELRTDEAWLVSPRLVRPAARKEVENGNVFVYNFDELIDEQADFGKYFKWLDNEIAKRKIKDYYVDLACNVPELDREGKRIGESPWSKIDGYINIWIDDPGKEHISLLGEFGTGKTWFCLHYSHKKVEKYLEAKKEGIQRPRLPLFIPLRDYAKAITVESLFSEFILRKHEIGLPSYRAFELLNRMGKFILIFDGFDEMARKVDYQTVVNNFWQLAKVVVPGSKAILTCRTEHFRYSQESREILSAKVKASTSNIVLEPPHFEVAYIEKLNNDQIKEIIVKRRQKEIGKEAAEDIAERILKHPTLSSLSRRPIQVEFILDSFPEIEKLTNIDLTKVFYFSCKKKLEKDIKEERTFTSMADKIYFMCELAWEMLSKSELKLHYKFFPERIRRYFPQAVREEELDHWHFDMLRQTLLIRDADGNYQFDHKSLSEFFVAYKFASELGILADEFLDMARSKICDKEKEKSVMSWSGYFRKIGETCPPLEGFGIEKLENLKATVGKNILSPEIKQFIAGLSDRRRCRELIEFIKTVKGMKFDEVGYLCSNILTLLNECGEFEHGRNKDFDFSELLLSYADLYGANLKRCNFNSSDLSNATLHSANLADANLSDAVLKSADLSDAILERTNCSNAELTDARLGDIDDVLEAIVDESGRFVIFIINDNTIRVWDSSTGKELKYFELDSLVKGAIWSKDGKRILAWSENGVICLWDVATGGEINIIKHRTPIDGVFWSKDGKRILAWSENGVICLWDVATGKKMQSIERETPIDGVFWSKDGKRILAWNKNGVICLWDIASGEEINIIKHRTPIDGVFWSKDEKKILLWSVDNAVILLDLITGKKIKVIKCKSLVETVIWSADEKKVLIRSSYAEKTSKYLFSQYSDYRFFLGYLRMFDPPPRYRYPLAYRRHDILKTTFENNNHSLTDDFIIVKIKPKAWVILDGYLRYLISDIDTRLDVYEITDMRELIDPYLFRIIEYREEMSRQNDTFHQLTKTVPINWRSSIVSIWNLAKGEEIRFIEHRTSIDGVLWSKDEKNILMWDNSVMQVWKTSRGRETASFEYEPIISPYSVTWSKDGKRILAWSKDDAFLWDIEEGKFQTYEHYSKINGACWLREEGILTWSKDGTARLWSIETGNEIGGFKSKIDCKDMNISKAKGLSKAQYIALLNKGAYIPIEEVRDLKLSIQTRLDMFNDWNYSI